MDKDKDKPGHEPDKLVETYGAIAVLVDLSNQFLKKVEKWPYWQPMIKLLTKGESVLLWTAPQKSSIKNKKNKTKMKQGETWSSRSDGLQPNVRITLSRERERDIIHEDEDSISSWKPIQIYKSFQTVRTRFTQKPSNYIWLLSNPVKALSFNFPTTCPSSSVDIAPPPPLKN